jgi:hypothetical protein
MKFFKRHIDFFLGMKPGMRPKRSLYQTLGGIIETLKNRTVHKNVSVFNTFGDLTGYFDYAGSGGLGMLRVSGLSAL